MTHTNDLPYYPRFVFSCSDDRVYSTGDLDLFKFIKEVGSENDIESFKPGQNIEITWNSEEGGIVRYYIVKSIEIRQIKYDLDKPIYGVASGDVPLGHIEGKEKECLMEIYVFLDVIE